MEEEEQTDADMRDEVSSVIVVMESSLKDGCCCCPW